MYLRRRSRTKNGVEYKSWALVETVRTARGPRQRTIATIGKLPGLDKEERIGWEAIGRFLDGKPPPQPNLFKREDEAPLWSTVDLKRVSIERMRHFGDVYLGLPLWNRLGLSTFCQEHIPPGREEVSWSAMAAVLTLARFCAPSSELQIAESWYAKTALDDLVGVPAEKINDDRLYRALDVLLPHKDALCRHSGSGSEVCLMPEGTNETFLFCRSEGRREKEQAILNRFIVRLETGLLKLKENAEKSKRPDRQKVERRIGRLLERNSRAASLFDVSVEERQTENGARLAVTIRKQEERTEWALHTSGSYLLRTNWHGRDPKELWK